MENPNQVPDLVGPLPKHPNALPFTTTPYTVCRRNSLKTQGPKGKYWEDLLTNLGLDFRGTDAHKKIELVAVARESGDLETSLWALQDCAEVQLYSPESQRLSKLCALAAIEIAQWALDRFWTGKKAQIYLQAARMYVAEQLGEDRFRLFSTGCEKKGKEWWVGAGLHPIILPRHQPRVAVAGALEAAKDSRAEAEEQLLIILESFFPQEAQK